MSRPNRMSRRRLVLGILGSAVAAGCGGPTRALEPVAPEPPPIVVHALADLVSAASLRWLLWVRPVEWLAEPGLRDPIGKLLRDERLDLFAQTTGLELRTLDELAVASFGDDSVLLLGRHRADPIGLERLFRARLTSDEHRVVEPGGVVRVTGRIGRETRAFVALGRTVVGLQFGGSPRLSAALVAQRYAQGGLRSVPPVGRDPRFGETLAALGNAPLRWLLPGPFEGELATGAHGLLGVATAVGAALDPTGGRDVTLMLVVDGSYETAPERAAALLLETWQELTENELGSLLGLAEPRRAPAVEAGPMRIRLTVTLDAEALGRGLAAATMDDVREIMR